MSDICKFLVVGDPHNNSTPPHSRKDDYAMSMFKKHLFIFRKAEEIEADFIMYLGDFSHKTTQPTEYTNQMLKALRSCRKKKYCLVGNHDTYAGNVELIDKTFLGTMFASGALLRANKHWSIKGVNFRGYDYEHQLYNPEPFPDKEGINIAFAHAFIQEKQDNFKAKDYLSLDGFVEAGCDHLFVGHDHVQYPAKVYNGMKVYRGGSLSRGTKNVNQMEKTPIIYACKVESGKVQVVKVPVPCAPKEDVYDLLQIEHEGISSLIKDFVTELKSFKNEDLNIFTLIEDLAPSDDVKETCFSFLEARGILPER